MFGFNEHTTNPRTGRPEPHPSWLRERWENGLATGLAVAFAAFAAYDFWKWGVEGGAAQLAAGAVVIGLIAYARHVMLARKRRKYLKAVAAYEAAIAAATDWDETP